MDDYTTKEVKFVNDPKSLSALAKIHEISNKAKERRARKSPNHINHIRFEDKMNMDKNKEEPNFSRRKSHFPTMVYAGFNILRPKEEKKEGMRRSYINRGKPGAKDYKSEFVWDKVNNKLVEKKIPLGGLGKIEEKEEKFEQKPKNEIKDSQPTKSEKSDIIQKLKEYKKSNNPEVVYGKKVVKESEIKEDDKNIVGSKNTKIYKKIIKDEKGSKIIIKKVVEEISDSKEGDKLVFDDDSDDDEDLEKELDKIEKDTSEKNDMKYQIIKEKFDPKGNKIYSKEIVLY